MSILVITSGNDPHVAMVEKHGVGTIIWWDPTCCTDDEIDFQISVHGSLILKGGVDLSEISAVWYRKPQYLDMTKMDVPAEYRAFTHSAYVHFYKLIFSLLSHRLWVSDPWNIFRANNKFLQLEDARCAGLRVPETLITNSPANAARFVERVDRVVAKPISTEFVVAGGVVKTMYATEVTTVTNYAGLKVAPAILQRLVEGLDVRVTVVGTKVFACSIEKTGDLSGVPDWRRGNQTDKLVYKSIDFALGKECIEMLVRMGLSFGAFDFIWDGTAYWFLEVNPNGQWGFVEEQTGLPISKAMADLLTGR